MRISACFVFLLGWLLAPPAQAAGLPSAEVEQAAKLREEGYLASLKGDRMRTDACFQEALKLDPMGYGYHVSYGLALCNLHDYETALKVWERGFKGPDKAYWNRAVCQALAHYQLGHTEAAVEWYHLQKLGNIQWGALSDMRHLISYWRDSEKQAIEAVYRIWSQTERRSARMLSKLQPKLRSLSDYEVSSPRDRPLAEYKLRIQSRLDQLFIRELKSIRLLTRTDKQIALHITVSSEGMLSADTEELDSVAFTEPVFAKAALQALGSLAESMEPPPVADNGATRSLRFKALFEVQPLPESDR